MLYVLYYATGSRLITWSVVLLLNWIAGRSNYQLSDLLLVLASVSWAITGTQAISLYWLIPFLLFVIKLFFPKVLEICEKSLEGSSYLSISVINTLLPVIYEVSVFYHVKVHAMYTCTCFERNLDIAASVLTQL